MTSRLTPRARQIIAAIIAAKLAAMVQERKAT